MNKKLKEEWIVALRSGEYTQAKLTLKYAGLARTSHCCLGVLCEVIGPREMLRITPWDIETKFSGMSATKHLARLARLTRDQVEELIRMNDAAGKSFHEIADWIEENL